jgi:Arc/MetJ-type ribon-helix-helix transcriptional regulator
MSDDSQAKKHVAARVSPDTAAEIERLQNEGDRSQSEAVRELLRRGIEADRLQRERDSLQNQLNTLAGREREHGELVEYVEQEKSLKERERERRDAPIWKRARWFVLGRPEIKGIQ